MAWTVKPSGTMSIERRKEPWLTAKMIAKYQQEIMPRYATRLGSLMSILHDVQHHYGYIPFQAMEEIAKLLEVTPAQVLDTVSFYEEYRTEPAGKYVIGVCQSIACEACGHKAILDHLRTKLGVEPHETTEDGKFTLLAMECLGSCDTAPVALVNEELKEGLTIKKMDEILDSLPD
ncbi:MAG TPA: NAD(P)H-dependent oxidoreductase subunit E [Phycisphaerales bacterium]|nr:NAD(P)H-dependent oxidoreductase subunit E [Phycisphaerales bacterium]